MTHSTDPVGIINSNKERKTQVVDDYLLVPQDDPSRPAIYASGDLYTYLITSQETDFDFNFFDFFLPVDGGPPPHLHPYEHETWYITAGNIRYDLGNQGTDSIVLPEGSLIFGARNRVHGYYNIDSAASISGTVAGARTLSLTTPGALDLFFDNAGIPITDRNAPIPTFGAGGDEAYRKLAEFQLRTGAGIKFVSPDFQPPADAQDYLLVLPEDAEGEVVEKAKKLSKIDGFSVWTTGKQEGLAQRPTIDGPFDIEYTSLASLEETGNELSYNQFSLAPQTANHCADVFPDSVKSDNHELFYVQEGELTFKIGDQVKLARPDTSVYIAPGQEYSIANFGDTEVESLAVSIPQVDNPIILPDDTGYNPIEGSEDNDLLIARSKDKLLGNAGDDILKIGSGGDNLLYGGAGSDQFWIANGSLPNTVPDSRQIIVQQPPFPNLLPLEDTRNTIVDFEVGIDKIYINSISGISDFDDLKLLPAFGDLRSTSIIATLDGKDISLANLTGVAFNQLAAEDFVFA
ncbi:MAG: cupin domain-containing protein [Nostoc sp. C3-bin3]|nr:cupin domain-containing protein [Nostoc sp. C3-bin3]